jgi:hypothetical protein
MQTAGIRVPNIVILVRNSYISLPRFTTSIQVHPKFTDKKAPQRLRARVRTSEEADSRGSEELAHLLASRSTRSSLTTYCITRAMKLPPRPAMSPFKRREIHSLSFTPFPMFLQRESPVVSTLHKVSKKRDPGGQQTNPKSEVKERSRSKC